MMHRIKMHRIKLKLYPNHLPSGQNTFLARTDSEATLTIEQVCAAMRDCGGTFKTEHDTPDPKKNPLTLCLRTQFSGTSTPSTTSA